MTQITHFSVAAANAQAVYLAGSFNDWKPDTLPMTKDAHGLWTCDLTLPAGPYEYKFVIDDQWCCELGCDRPYSGCPKCVPNEFGTMNRVIEVAGSNSKPGAIQAS